MPTYLVTGAGGAIGAQVCRTLVAGGAQLAITDLSGDPLDKLVADGIAAVAAPVDVTDLAAFEAFVDIVTDRLGPIDGLVNVAGAFAIRDFVDSDPVHWDAMLDANLRTTLVACRCVLPDMLRRGSGAIVNFASTAGEYGSIRPSAVYAAAKGGVIAFTKSLAREVSPHGIRVNAVSPGPVDTGMFHVGDPDLADAARAEGASRTLVGRMGTPADLAAAVAYLIGPDAGYVTGAVLRVNGGSLL